MGAGSPTKAFLAAAVIGLASLGLAPSAAAAEPDPPDWGYELAHDLMSPFCPGRSLADCPSPQAESLRAWILVQAATGRSRADVEAELLARYGDVILSAPRAEGIGLAAYVIPVVVFLAGGLLVAVLLRRYTRAAPPAPTRDALDPELARLVDEELERGNAPAGRSE